ncbi:hypothetical protein D3C85_1626810 [compost metagenome]
MRCSSRLELILVPVQAENPLAWRRYLRPLRDGLQHLFFGSHPGKVQHVQLHAVHAQMHMGINQTGQDMPPVPIGDRIFSSGQLQRQLLAFPYGRNDAVLHKYSITLRAADC